MLNLDHHITLNSDTIFAPNLCDRFTARDLSAIGETVKRGFARDKSSRSKWEDRMKAAMDLSMQIQEPKNWPWPGCSNVVFPLITIGALQFSARSYSNIIQGTNIIRYRVIGKQSLQAHERALRIGKHMSWQMLEEDASWEEQHDRLLINLAVVGSAWVKTYYSGSHGYPVSELVMAKDLYVDYFAKATDNAARKTHRLPLYRNEIIERTSGENPTFKNVRDESWFNQPPITQQHDPSGDRRSGMHPPQSDDYTPFFFLEQHCLFDFDQDGYYEPYIVTIEEHTDTVCRIVSRVEREEDIERWKGKIVKIKAQEYFTHYTFIPSPDGGIYGMGFGMFLGPINEAVDSGINQLIDAGTMQTSLGGFLGRGAKIRSGVYTMAPWQWARVDATGDDLRKSIVPFPDREPSDVLFKLLGLLIEYANRVAGTVDATVGENPGQNTPASTFQGMTESGLQIFNVIFKRVWRSLKEEAKQRYNLNKVYLPDKQDFGSGNDFIRREDYLGNPDQVVPVANPRITSTVMRGMQLAAVKQDSMATAGYDLYEVTKDFLESLEVEDIDRIYPGPGKVPQGHEMINPKISVEQLKLQAKQLDIRAKQIEWANKLMEDQRVNNAKIRLYEAQALKAASEANAADAQLKIEAFNQLIEAHKAYGDMLNQRISALTGESSDGQNTDQAGVRRMEGPSGNKGGNGVSVEVPGGSKVSVGTGDVQQ